MVLVQAVDWQAVQDARADLFQLNTPHTEHKAGLLLGGPALPVLFRVRPG